ncbi:MAG: hypothetical protein PVG70_11105 [Desulfobacterales bacterium]|jgi:hypothetical protein
MLRFFSASKSVTSILIGIAMDQGKLSDNEFLYSLKDCGDVRLNFIEDGTGEITQMVAYFGYANITFNKIS